MSAKKDHKISPLQVVLTTSVSAENKSKMKVGVK